MHQHLSIVSFYKVFKQKINNSEKGNCQLCVRVCARVCGAPPAGHTVTADGEFLA